MGFAYELAAKDVEEFHDRIFPAEKLAGFPDFKRKNGYESQLPGARRRSWQALALGCGKSKPFFRRREQTEALQSGDIRHSERSPLKPTPRLPFFTRWRHGILFFGLGLMREHISVQSLVQKRKSRSFRLAGFQLLPASIVECRFPELGAPPSLKSRCWHWCWHQPKKLICQMFPHSDFLSKIFVWIMSSTVSLACIIRIVSSSC